MTWSLGLEWEADSGPSSGNPEAATVLPGTGEPAEGLPWIPYFVHLTNSVIQFSRCPLDFFF